VTPPVSLALAVTVTLPDTVAPLAGAVMATVGAVVSRVIFTVWLVLAEIFPAASLAQA
jgi:hypothetical protein